MTENEIWKDVVGYEGYYQVSNKGSVRSLERIDNIGRKHRGRTLRLLNHNGYRYIRLSKNGVTKTYIVHRLVAEAFIPNPKGLLEINHIDEDKINNNIENLEWCTRKHNVNHGTRTEKAIKKLSKKIKAVHIKTGEVLTFDSTQDAGSKGFNGGGVAQACNGTYKSSNGHLVGGDGRTYRGHRWSYE